MVDMGELTKKPEVEKAMQEFMERYGVSLDDLKGVIKGLEAKEEQRRKIEPSTKEKMAGDLLNTLQTKLGEVFGHAQELKLGQNDVSQKEHTNKQNKAYATIYLKLAGIVFTKDENKNDIILKNMLGIIGNKMDPKREKIHDNLLNRMDQNGEFKIPVIRTGGRREDGWTIDVRESVKFNLLVAGKVYATKDGLKKPVDIDDL